MLTVYNNRKHECIESFRLSLRKKCLDEDLEYERGTNEVVVKGGGASSWADLPAQMYIDGDGEQVELMTVLEQNTYPWA